MRFTHFHFVLFIVAVAAQRPTVTLNDGIYVGTTAQVASATAVVNQFFGVPYAAKPGRWMPAQLRPSGTEKHDAISQPQTCIQQSGT